MTDGELLADVKAPKGLMAAVATGGPGIDSVNGEYTERGRAAGALDGSFRQPGGGTRASATWPA